MSDRITERPGWDEYFMEMAEVARKRSTCLRRAVGAIIVKDNRILATGYNGVPSGIEHCSVRGCQREALGVSIDNATLYCTNQPCILCAKMIINAGIKRIVIKEGYPDAGAEQMLAEAGLRVEKLGESSAKALERSADHVLER